jgi:hypothetical protein
MKTPAELTRSRVARAFSRKQAAAERHASIDAAYRGQRPEPAHDDAPEPAPLTAGFDRAHAERLGPGCYRVLAAPMHY